LARVLSGTDIPAARQAHALLVERIVANDKAGRLALPVEQATQLAWASANAAALLHVTGALQGPDPSAPVSGTVARLRDLAIQAICTPQPVE
jgi:hypothetical protein